VGQVLATVVPRTLQPCKSLICITFCISDLSSSFSHCVEVLAKKESGSNSDFLFVHATTNRTCYNLKWHSFSWTLYNKLYFIYISSADSNCSCCTMISWKRRFTVCVHMWAIYRGVNDTLFTKTSRPALDPPPSLLFPGYLREILPHA